MRYLLFSFTLAILAFPQNASPRSLSQPTQRRPTGQVSNSNEHQTDSEESALVVKILPTEQSENESHYNSSERTRNPDKVWGLREKIAVIATIVAFLQFAALVCTVCVMVSTGRRQLRAYVLPEAGALFDGTT